MNPRRGHLVLTVDFPIFLRRSGSGLLTDSDPPSIVIERVPPKKEEDTREAKKPEVQHGPTSSDTLPF